MEYNLKNMSDLSAPISYQRALTQDQFKKLRQGVSGMANGRWAVKYDDNRLGIYRSWTGQQIFRLEIIPEEKRYMLSHVWVCRDKNIYDYDDEQTDILLLDSIIDELVS